MPHKRKRQERDESSNDLPPSALAKPLPARKDGKDRTASAQPKPRKQIKAARKSSTLADDTPKAFQRLMQFQKTGKRPNGLDDGSSQPSKEKRKRTVETSEARAPPARKPLQEWEAPKIQPGEHMSDFRARVNRELPISGLVNRAKNTDGLKESQTRTEKKIQRKIALWREEEARRKEKLEEERDMVDQDDAADFNLSEGLTTTKLEKSTKGAKRRSQDDDDPWAKLKADRGERAALHDVVQAPPNFKKLPMQKFKIENGARVDVANVPGRAGASLRQREQLGDTRRSIIESYRNMMGNRRSGAIS